MEPTEASSKLKLFADAPYVLRASTGLKNVKVVLSIFPQVMPLTEQLLNPVFYLRKVDFVGEFDNDYCKSSA